MENNLTIVFIGFDGYSDLWDDCFNLYNMFWQDRPYRTLFVNNEKDVHYENVEVLHTSLDSEWSKKVQLAVKECKTKYICLLLEDFFVGSKIDNETINETMKLIKEDKIKYFKLTNMNRAYKNNDARYKTYKYLHIIPQDDEYGISLQPAIWDKEFLSKLLGDDNYNAWIFEFNRVKEAQGKKNIPQEGCLFDDRNILNLKHGVIQSKYIPTTIKYFKKNGYKLNIQRATLSNLEYFKLRVTSFMKYLLPRKFRKPVKKLLEKNGAKFVSTVRDK